MSTKQNTPQDDLLNAMHLANVMHAKKGALIQWKNYLGIWQTGTIEVPYNPKRFGRAVGVRRLPPEDSEGLPNDEVIMLAIHEHPGSVRVKE